MTAYIIPAVIAIILAIGLARRVDVFSEFMEGAFENLKTAIEIAPALIALILAVSVFRASGASALLSQALAPFAEKIGFPAECIPLALIRPISGSGALAVYEGILSDYGADSFVGRVASVLQGASETTFYTIAVYFSVTKVRKTRHTLACSLSGDLVCFIMSVLLVRLFM